MKKRLGALLLIVSVLFSCFIFPVHGEETGVQYPYSGIDVSSHNKTINWGAVKNSGVKYAMIRSGYGGDPGYWDQQKDTCFEQNYTGATQNGIKVGVYHYSYATNTTMAEQEAGECLYILNGRPLDYPVAYDLEDQCQWGLSKDTMGQIAQAFCNKIQQAGYKAIVYTGVNYYNNHLPDTLKSQYDIWIAHYTSASSPNFSGYTMWQYSSTGSVSGISGSVDVNYGYYDYTVPVGTFRCDTPAYTFGNNTKYTYKITTDSTTAPTAVSSNPSAITVSDPIKVPDGYLFTITNVSGSSSSITTTSGDGNTSVSFLAKGKNVFLCDTSSYKFGSNAQYIFKITTFDSTPPTVVSSNPSAVSIGDIRQTTDGYLIAIRNNGNGDAQITTTSCDGVRSVSFTATGNKVFRCDTSSYTFGSNAKYIYKITTYDADPPTAQSSNPSAVSIGAISKTSDGYLITIQNNGSGAAQITTTSADGSQTASFTATGTKTFRCDTSSYTFANNSQYTYKITTSDSTPPTARSSNPSAVSVSGAAPTNGGYLFTIYNKGQGSAVITTTASDGTSVSFPANGTSSSSLRSDTPYYFTMKQGSYYTYKFTGAPGASYDFFCAGNSVVRSVSLTQSNGSYFYKIYAYGKGCVGMYATANNTTKPVSIVTVN